MSLLRVVVSYEPSGARIGTWRLNPSRSGIVARFRLGSAPETIVETRLRCVRDKRSVPDAVWFAPVTPSMDVWLTASDRFADQCGVPVAIQLNGCIDEALRVLREW